VIAAWPSFALIGAYELLMRQVRRTATVSISPGQQIPRGLEGIPGSTSGRGRVLQREAWQWAKANRTGDGSLPSGREIGRRYGRHERWGRLVKRSGCSGEYGSGDEPGLPVRNPPGRAA
jgi:hypothetical protein